MSGELGAEIYSFAIDPLSLRAPSLQKERSGRNRPRRRPRLWVCRVS